jgi:glycine cleavage system H protein
MDTYRKCYLIPPEEKQCLWMSAGVVSYRLCDRMFDCDTCPTDQALRGSLSLPVRTAADDAIPARTANVQELPREGYQFSRNHWWVRRTGPDTFRLGIESGVSQVLQGAKGIVFPAPQQALRGGQTSIWVIMDGGTVPLEVPVDGQVRSVNYELVAKPHLLAMKPFTDGWLLELQPSSPELAAGEWMTAEEAQPVYRIDQTRFITSLTSAIRGKRSQVGASLADGGEKLQSLIAILGLTRYIAMVRQYFGSARR